MLKNCPVIRNLAIWFQLSFSKAAPIWEGYDQGMCGPHIDIIKEGTAYQSTGYKPN